MINNTGEIIYREKDQYGSIEVIDYMDKVRALHFGNQTQQSAMLLGHPYLLIHRYTQAMLVPTCWHKPTSALLLGLGAGSIAKYLYHYFNKICVDIVELRASIVSIATHFFHLPERNARFNIYTESAHHWISRGGACREYDIIMVDIFLTTSGGEDYSIDLSRDVYTLYNMLSDEGVIVFNHLGNDVENYSGINTIKKLFGDNLCSINIDAVNTIIIASKNKISIDFSESYINEKELKYKIPYGQYMGLLKAVI